MTSLSDEQVLAELGWTMRESQSWAEEAFELASRDD